MAGNLPKADPATLLNSPHHKSSQVSRMDEKQISNLLVLGSNSNGQTLRDCTLISNLISWSFWGSDVNKGPQKQ